MGKKTKVKHKNKSSLKLLKILNVTIIITVLLSLYYSVGGIDAIKYMFIIILNIIVSFIVVINIHEFGHYVFGKLYGYELLSYRVGFFAWNKENGQIKFSIIKNRGYSGFCAMIPPEEELQSYKYVLFYAGGILFNFISGVIFLVVAQGVQHELISFLLGSIGLVSILIGGLNFIPFISGNNPTDGKVIWSLLLKKPFAETMLTLKRLISELSSGIRPRHLNIPELNLEKPSSFDSYFSLYAYFKALDTKDYDQLMTYAKLLEEDIERVPTVVLPGIYNELCFVGCIMDDLAKAKKYYKKSGRILKKDKDINGCRIKAYYEYYVNQDSKAAMEFCNQGLAVKDKFPIKGQALMEEDLIRVLIHLITNK